MRFRTESLPEGTTMESVSDPESASIEPTTTEAIERRDRLEAGIAGARATRLGRLQAELADAPSV